MTKWQAITIQWALFALLGAMLSAPWVSPLRVVLIFVAEIPLGVSLLANLWKVSREDRA